MSALENIRASSKGSQNSPVVGRDVTSIAHLLPLIPALDTIRSGIPNPLTPDHILELERATVIHDPFGDLAARDGSDLRHRGSAG